MLTHNLATALRHFRQHKLTTSINVIGLALGIACFVIAYAVVTYMRSSEVAFPASSRTYVISQLAGATVPMSSGPVAKYLKVDVPELTVAQATGGPAMGPGSDAQSLKVGDYESGVSPVFVDPEFLDIFPLHFVAGDRTQALRNPRSVVVSESAARRFFGNGAALGRQLLLNGETVTVTGVVTPPPQPSHLSDSSLALMRFEVLASMDVYEAWLALQVGYKSGEERWNSYIYLTYVQLPADGSLSAAELADRLRSFGERHVPNTTNDRAIAAKPITTLTSSVADGLSRASVSTVLMTLGGLVLLVACFNYANFATAQAASRTKEVGMHKVLGATRTQVMGQHLFETLLLTSVASLVALIAVEALAAILRSSLSIDLAPVMLRTWSFWTFLAAVVGGVSILAGLYPALLLSRLRPAQTLRAGRRRFGSRTLAGWLVGLQFAVASMLIIAVLTMHRQNEAMHQAFAVRSDPVVVLQPSLKVAGIDFDVLRGELTRSPSISTVSALRNPPWSMSTSTTRVARRVEALGEAPNVRTHSVAHDFFAAFGIQVLAGRVFEERLDDASLSENARLSPNIVVDRAFTAQLGFASPADALDTVVYAAPADPGVPPSPARIVGVVETRQMGLLGFWGASNIYVLNVPQSSYAVVRVKRDQLRDGLAAIDATWRELAPDIALRRSFADELFERGYRYFDGIRRVFTGIAIFALLIAVMGLVGMAVHIVGGRTHEVGVRKTLGASQSRVLAMLMSDFSKPVLIANLIAWPLAFLVEQGYVRVLVERASVSLAPYLLGLALTLAIAWLAVVGQAVRAAGVRPARVLRYE